MGDRFRFRRCFGVVTSSGEVSIDRSAVIPGALQTGSPSEVLPYGFQGYKSALQGCHVCVVFEPFLSNKTPKTASIHGFLESEAEDCVRAMANKKPPP
jgi:hypothetical protein